MWSAPISFHSCSVTNIIDVTWCNLHQSHWKNLFKVRKRLSKMTAVEQKLELVFVRMDAMLMPINQSIIWDQYLAVNQRRVNNITYIIYIGSSKIFSKISGSFLPKRLGFSRVKSLYRFTTKTRYWVAFKLKENDFRKSRPKHKSQFFFEFIISKNF